MTLRLSAEDRTEFPATLDSRTSAQHGREMEESVVVPDALLDDQEEPGPWFTRSYDWIGTLEPKPTLRKGPGELHQQCFYGRYCSSICTTLLSRMVSQYGEYPLPYQDQPSMLMLDAGFAVSCSKTVSVTDSLVRHGPVSG